MTVFEYFAYKIAAIAAEINDENPNLNETAAEGMNLLKAQIKKYKNKDLQQKQTKENTKCHLCDKNIRSDEIV